MSVGWAVFFSVCSLFFLLFSGATGSFTRRWGVGFGTRYSKFFIVAVVPTLRWFINFDHSFFRNHRRTPRNGNREGEGQRIRNRIIQKMTHREGLKKKAFDNGESVDDWDKIVLVGKKIRQQQPVTLSLPSEALSVMEES